MIAVAMMLSAQLAARDADVMARAVFPETPVFARLQGDAVKGQLEILAQLDESPDRRIVVVAASEPSESQFDPDRSFVVRLAGVRKTEQGWKTRWIRDISREIPERLDQNDLLGAQQCAELSATLLPLPEPSLFLLSFFSRISGQGGRSKTDLTIRTLSDENPGVNLLRISGFTEFGKAGFVNSYSKGGELRWRDQTPQTPALVHLTAIEQTRSDEETRPPHFSYRAFAWRDGHFEPWVGPVPGMRSKPLLALQTETERVGTPASNAECETLRAFTSSNAQALAAPSPNESLNRWLGRLRSKAELCGPVETLEIRKVLLNAAMAQPANETTGKSLAAELRKIDHELVSRSHQPDYDVRGLGFVAPAQRLPQLLNLIQRYPWDVAAPYALCEGELEAGETPAQQRQGCRTAIARLGPLAYELHPDIRDGIEKHLRRLGCLTTETKPERYFSRDEDLTVWLKSFACPQSPPRPIPR